MKKIFIILLTLFLLCGCTKPVYDDSDSYDVDNYTYDESELVADNEVMEKNEVSVPDYTGYAWHADSQNEDSLLPLRFRSVYTEFKKPSGKNGALMDTSYEPSREGFEKLCMSGSSQFGADQFFALQDELDNIAKGKTIYIVDLRQESHFILNDEISVCWYGLNNWANLGKDLKQVVKTETEQSDAAEDTTIEVGNVDSDGNLIDSYEIYCYSMKVEKEFVEENGYNYVRFAATDHVWPSADVVDDFIDFVKSLPSNAWLHFHCEAGKGRTTTFMYMYDCLKNPNVDLKDISYRECEIGGTYIFYEGEFEFDDDAWMADYYKEKADKAWMFYEYCQENYSNNYKKSWSEWLTENSDTEVNNELTEID